MELNETKKKLLRLDLQTFAEGDEPKPEDDPKPSDEPKDDDPKPTEGDPEPKPEDEKTFTQADIDRIVKERLDREKRKRDEALEEERRKAEEQRLAEEGKYKELYEKLQAELADREKKAEEARKETLKTKKESLLTKAGYSEDQVAKYLKYIEGESDEDIQASLDALKADIPPKKYVDPSAGNGKKHEPKKQDLTDKGREAVKRLRAKGRIR